AAGPFDCPDGTPLVMCMVEHNPGFHPVYFEVPVLVRYVYRDFEAQLAQFIAQHQPLLMVRGPEISSEMTAALRGYVRLAEWGVYDLFGPAGPFTGPPALSA